MTDVLYEYGYKGERNNNVARVVAVHRRLMQLASEHGTLQARLKSSEFFDHDRAVFPTVGDFVEIIFNPSGDSLITKTLPRSSLFERADPSVCGAFSQSVAANFDYVFIVLSMNKNFSAGRLQRYLIQARASAATPVIVLSKADLPENPTDFVQAAKNAAGSTEIISVSIVSGVGVDRLSEYLAPRKTVVLLGSSGVGKSSLINKIADKEVMETGEIRESDGRGRHTTTYRQLIKLPSGAMVIDTPGMRELSLWNATNALSDSYSRFETLMQSCRFRDCSHTVEPGCAVLEAVKNGELSKKELRDYRNLKKEAGRSAKRRVNARRGNSG